ncbi:ArsR/SmtB family transcription factor [Lentzea flaviverrucosa]|uniref:DNA-binding transcriptional regulator, ArsR family n=1 Tax=Lentzea flaviverrucosa TaxID=200379 RepID=A0A1H9EPG7_9PSEU|nr:metalloregulator ArsR/SmtB family transcription factor [Lentzea flaviverrucosa]RDI35438.1 DNA-binding transcriptional ArsR family regulator [Lentzea flaviverrucosa]SEQ27103.1 DNA-binding transcriptional regulator, ArsR family [Lentzea flaviverrucosa]
MAPAGSSAQLTVVPVPGRGEQPVVVAKFFRALGDPTRLRLLEFLLDGERTVSECVDHVELSQGRVSVHLACLADCGYIQARRQGRWCYYRVDDPRVADLVGLARSLATDNCTAVTACGRIDARGPDTAIR